MEERRQSDKRIDEIHESIIRIEKILIGEKGDNGLCGRMGICETKQASTQVELKEHKAGHWKSATLIIAGAGVFATILVKLVH